MLLLVLLGEGGVGESQIHSFDSLKGGRVSVFTALQVVGQQGNVYKWLKRARASEPLAGN